MSEMDIHQILKSKNYKNGGQMTLMEILLVLTCTETENVQ